MLNKIQCIDVEELKEKEETFIDIQLQVNNCKNLDDSLKIFL